MLRILGVMLITGIAASPVTAAVYKCTGNDSRVTYQDTPCREGAGEIVMAILDDRAYDPPPSAQMQQATEELRRQDRELTERLDKDREERALREAQRPPPYYGSGSRFPLPLPPSGYWGGFGRLHPGLIFPPRPVSHPPVMPLGALPEPAFSCLACPLSRPGLTRQSRADSHKLSSAMVRRGGTVHSGSRSSHSRFTGTRAGE